jgi:hypothetical protein
LLSNGSSNKHVSTNAIFAREKINTTIMDHHLLIHKECDRKGSVAKKKSSVEIFKGLDAKIN